MSDHDTRPTPASGLPATVATRREARASVKADEPSEGATILVALQRLESKTDAQGKVLERLTDQVNAHGKQLGELASAQVSTARAAAAAAEIAAQALAKANSSHDENVKMVQSAMEIQRGAIEAAVTRALVPIAKKVDELELARADDQKKQGDRDRQQDERFAAFDATQQRIAYELGLEPAQPGTSLVATRMDPPGRLRALTRQQKVAAVLIILANISAAIAALLK